MIYVQLMRNFFAPIGASWWLLDSFWHPEPKNNYSYFVDVMYVEFMKNFLLADSSELMAVRLILASWAKKQVIPTLYIWCTSSSWKIFFSPIRASWWLLDSFWHADSKNNWFLLCRRDVRRVDEKFSSRRSSELMAVRLILGFWTQKQVIPTL